MNHTRHLLHYVRRSATASEAVSDGQLLQRFLDRRDEEAFTALLARHGVMVWSLCLRVLGNADDAEDAFQATFLVLVKKAGTIAPRDRVGNWLYGVAHNAALKLREGQRRRRAREARAAARPPHLPLAPELSEVLDAELSRLPDKYREAVVACDLEGKTRAEAAQHLGWPEGTVAGRLARARELLARRLTRHGLAGAALPPAAAVPPALAAITGRAALAVAAGLSGAEVSSRALSLMQGVLKTMYLSQLKGITIWAMLLLAVGLGVGAAARPGAGRDGEEGAPPAAVAKGQQTPVPKVPTARSATTGEEELARLVGMWRLSSGTITEQDPPSKNSITREFTPAERHGYTLKIEADGALTFAKGGVSKRLKFVVSVAPDKSPRQINLYPLGSDEDKCYRGVYEMEGDRLRLACYDHWFNDKPPPRVGPIKLGDFGRYLVLERFKEASSDQAKKANLPNPPEPGGEYQKRLAGLWRVNDAMRGGKGLTAWERLGMRFDFGADGKLVVRGGRAAGLTEYTCQLDVEKDRGKLVLSPADSLLPLSIDCLFLPEGHMQLRFRETAGSPACTISLSRYNSPRHGTARPLGLRVAPGDSFAAKRLPGTWRLDVALTGRLRDKGTRLNVSEQYLAFEANPSVAGKVPDTFRELLGDRRVYQSGYMALMGKDKRKMANMPFVLFEHEGGPALLSFLKDSSGGEWGEESVMAVAIVPAAASGDDLLFLSTLGPAAGKEHAMAYQRSAD